jgi:hypothetical protein
VGSADDHDGQLSGERFEATDDLGTEYRPTGASGSHSSYSEGTGPIAVLGEAEFTPAVPEAAGELRIRRAASEWVARLR